LQIHQGVNTNFHNGCDGHVDAGGRTDKGKFPFFVLLNRDIKKIIIILINQALNFQIENTF
jgi:hypothetical protein